MNLLANSAPKIQQNLPLLPDWNSKSMVSSSPYILIDSGGLCEYSLAFFTRFVFTHRSRKHVHNSIQQSHKLYLFLESEKSRQLACKALLNLT